MTFTNGCIVQRWTRNQSMHKFSPQSGANEIAAGTIENASGRHVVPAVAVGHVLHVAGVHSAASMRGLPLLLRDSVGSAMSAATTCALQQAAMPHASDSHSSRTCAEPPPAPCRSISGESFDSRAGSPTFGVGGTPGRPAPYADTPASPKGRALLATGTPYPCSAWVGYQVWTRGSPGRRAARRWGRSRDVTSDHPRPTPSPAIAIAAAAAAHRSPANSAARPLQRGGAAGQERLKGRGDEGGCDAPLHQRKPDGPALDSSNGADKCCRRAHYDLTPKPNACSGACITVAAAWHRRKETEDEVEEMIGVE